jgi:putative membrane protein
MNAFLQRAAFAAIGFWLATFLVSGLSFRTPTSLLLAGLLLGVVNALVRPILIVLTLPFTVLTLGLFLFIVNAAMVGLVAWLLPDMHLDGFGAALETTVIVGIVSMIGSAFAGRVTRR